MFHALIYRESPVALPGRLSPPAIVPNDYGLPDAGTAKVLEAAKSELPHVVAAGDATREFACQLQGPEEERDDRDNRQRFNSRDVLAAILAADIVTNGFFGGGSDGNES